jgi:hypothetical protein
VCALRAIGTIRPTGVIFWYSFVGLSEQTRTDRESIGVDREQIGVDREQIGVDQSRPERRFASIGVDRSKSGPTVNRSGSIGANRACITKDHKQYNHTTLRQYQYMLWSCVSGGKKMLYVVYVDMVMVSYRLAHPYRLVISTLEKVCGKQYERRIQNSIREKLPIFCSPEKKKSECTKKIMVIPNRTSNQMMMSTV